MMFMTTSLWFNSQSAGTPLGYASGIALKGRRMRLSFVAGWREIPIPGALIHEVLALVTPRRGKITRKPDDCRSLTPILPVNITTASLSSP
jgi:hypothetical protein